MGSDAEFFLILAGDTEEAEGKFLPNNFPLFIPQSLQIPIAAKIEETFQKVL
jgi:hypothetical protein